MRGRLRITLRLRLKLRRGRRRRRRLGEGVWVCITVVELREGGDAMLDARVLIDKAAEEEEVPQRLRRRAIDRERAWCRGCRQCSARP